MPTKNRCFRWAAASSTFCCSLDTSASAEVEISWEPTRHRFLWEKSLMKQSEAFGACPTGVFKPKTKHVSICFNQIEHFKVLILFLVFSCAFFFFFGSHFFQEHSRPGPALRSTRVDRSEVLSTSEPQGHSLPGCRAWREVNWKQLFVVCTDVEWTKPSKTCPKPEMLQ